LRWLGGDMPELAGKILTYDLAAGGRIRALEVNARPGCACGAARLADETAAPAAAHNHSSN
jgi:hypothetical protein